MIPRIHRSLATYIAAFSLITLPVMARTHPGPSAGAEVTRSFIPQKAGSEETAVLHRRYTGSLKTPLPVGVLGGMFVLTGDMIRNERVYQTATDASSRPPSMDMFPPAPAEQALVGLGAIFIPHHMEGAPLYDVQLKRWNRFAQPEFVPPLLEISLSSTMDAKDLPFSMTFSPRDQGEISIKLTYQRFGSAQRLIPSVAYRLQMPSGWEFDLTPPYHTLLAWQSRSHDWRFYTGARLDPRQDPFLTAPSEDGSRVAGWAMGWTTTALLGMRRQVIAPLYLALELGIQRESYDSFREDNRKLKGLEVAWGPWARLSLETWVRTP